MSYYCNHFPEEIIEIDGVTYWAADADGAIYFRGDLVLNLTGNKNIEGAMSVPELAKHFEISFDELQIPWRDGNVPMVKSSFWTALHEYIIKKGYKDVAVHCFAGHGRTGTMLASLMVAVGGWNAKESVDYLREHYCKSVVETELQCLHLQELDYLFNDIEPGEQNQITPSSTYRKGNMHNGWNGHWLR